MKTRKLPIIRLGSAKRLTKGGVPGPLIEENGVRYKEE